MNFGKYFKWEDFKSNLKKAFIKIFNVIGGLDFTVGATKNHGDGK